MRRSTSMKEKFDKSLLKTVVCPVSKKTLKFNSKKNELSSKSAGLSYEIADGIPILIKEKAKKL